MRKEYGDFWDKQRLIDACLELEYRHSGDNMPKLNKVPWRFDEIQIERIQAVLKTHNIDYELLTEDFDCSDLKYELTKEESKLESNLYICNGIIHLVSYTITQESIDELQEIINSYLSDSYSSKEYDLTLYPTRCMFFHTIFDYRKLIFELEKHWAGVLTCPFDMSFACIFTDKVFAKDFKDGIEKIDRVLALLIGDNFATPIPVSELKAKYGYPEMSDSELDELMDDMW